MCSIELKFGMQDVLFFILNNPVRLKPILNSCNIEYLVQFKSK